MYRHFFKRIIDFTAAFFGLLILSPLIVVVAGAIYFATKSNPIFFQPRPGLHNRVFRIMKFKSMNEKKDAEGKLLSDSERLTPVGAFIRKTSLDELPQLLNVLKGDMSLIGPRPLFVRYLPYYTSREATRHDVRPGITGLAQVRGRNFLKWDDRLELDAQYVETLSLVNDIKILLETLKSVISRKDIEIIPGNLGFPLDIERQNKK